MEVIQLVLFVGASDILHRIRNMGVHCIILYQIYKNVEPIHCLCLDTFSDNALIINGPERITTTLEEKYLLQDLQGNEEKGVLSTNDPLSSNESYEVISKDELEPKSSKGESPISKENYEVFTHNDSQGEILKLYNSLTLLLQTCEKTWSPCSVHRCSPRSEYLFTYMMSMHRKQV
jgi:hypothetical protein